MKLSTCFLATLVLIAPGIARAQEPARKYLLERVDDAAVVQLYADGFKDLPLKQKLLTWHLYQASIAGRDIYYDQRHRLNLAMRKCIDVIMAHPEKVDLATRDEISRYAKLFWINSGPYNNLTARKFTLKCSQDAFKKAYEIGILGAGVRKEPAKEMVADLSSDLLAMFFDPEFEPIVTNKSPGPGKDILASSANHLYSGVTMRDLEGFKEHFGLNSRLVKKNGKLVEEVYRVGGENDKQIRKIVEHLNEATKYAEPATAKALRR